MGWQKSLPSLGLPAITFYPALVMFLGLPPQLSPQSHSESKVSVGFPPTQERGAPSRTAGGGSRSLRRAPPDRSDEEDFGIRTPSVWEADELNVRPSCVQQGQIPLTALMPKNNVGTTVAANPTLFWYVPKTTAKSAKFVLRDDEQNEVYRTTITLVGTPGIVNIKLPATTTPLKVGKTYEWQLALICAPSHSSNGHLVKGWLERTELSADMKAKLAQATLLEQARLYANDSIWQETLTIVADLRSSHPAEWQELLESVGLDKAIAKAPFVEPRPAAE